MGNLSSFNDSPITQALLTYWEKRGEIEDANKQRRYLGASSIGHECDKYLWLNFRGVTKPRFEPRMRRLLNRGDREEAVFVEELRGIGCEVWDVNPETGTQWAISSLGGHFAGHLDGIAIGIPSAPKTPHELELKTMNDANFCKLQKSGVEIAQPKHYAQMQVYMGHMKLERGLYLAVNKDTDEVYVERVKFDAKAFHALELRAERIITSIDAERCASRSEDFKCKFCDAHAICWGETGKMLLIDEACPIDCRSCCHATANMHGEGARWDCGKGLTTTIGKPCNCKFHIALPTFIPATPDSSDSENVTYMIEGHPFLNGPGEGAFSTEELRVMTPETVVDEDVQAAKKAFGGTIDYIDSLTLPERYPSNSCEHVWGGTASDFKKVSLSVLVSAVGRKDISVTRSFENDSASYWEYNGVILVAISKTSDLAYVLRGKE